jgi:hypothetical protein
VTSARKSLPELVLFSSTGIFFPSWVAAFSFNYTTLSPANQDKSLYISG